MPFKKLKCDDCEFKGRNERSIEMHRRRMHSGRNWGWRGRAPKTVEDIITGAANGTVKEPPPIVRGLSPKENIIAARQGLLSQRAGIDEAIAALDKSLKTL